MEFSLANIVDTYRQHMPYEFLLLDQSSDGIEFTFVDKSLRTQLQNLEPGQQFRLEEKQARHWRINKSAVGARRFDILVTDIKSFEKTDTGQIVNSTHYCESVMSTGHIHVGPNILIVDGPYFFYDLSKEYRFALHPEIRPIMPAIWQLYGMSDDLFEKLLYENPEINKDVIWAFLGSSTKAEVVLKLYPDARLFDGIEEMHFDLACRFAEAQKYIATQDLDYFVETVSRDWQKYLPIKIIGKGMYRDTRLQLVSFLEQVYLTNLLKDKYDFILDGADPDTGGLVHSYFDTQIYKNRKISFSKSIQEIKKEIALQKEAEKNSVDDDGIDTETDDLPF